MPERFALYYAPAPTSDLWTRAAQWLGRDPTGRAVEAADIPGIETAFRLKNSESARRYGFHATLKAPMALAPATTEADLNAALGAFVQRERPVGIGRLVVADIDGFVALIPEQQSLELTDFVGRVVEDLDPLRAPLGTADREKRIAHGRLTPRQIDLLDLYGYPYVLEEFRFHMTLTDRLSDGDRPHVIAAAERWFAAPLKGRHVLDRISVFHESAPGAPFSRHQDYMLGVTVDA